MLKGRSFLTLLDFSPTEIDYLLNLSIELKAKKRTGSQGNLLEGKNIVLIFDKPSTRTRCAFEVAAFDEKGCVTFLSNSHMGHKESIEDTAKVLGRLYDGLGFRGYAHQDVETLAQHAGIPVWNGLTDQYHPTQVLADFMTIREHFDKPLHQIKLVYVGNAKNNVARSLMVGATKVGMHFTNLSPTELQPEKDFIESMQKLAAETAAVIQWEENIAKAVLGADVIYTDVWVSMGEEETFSTRIELLKPYQVNTQMVQQAENERVVVMHCLPAFHNLHTQVSKEIQQQYGISEMEVTDEVFQSHHSIAFDQAENRMHSIKALMAATIGNEGILRENSI